MIKPRIHFEGALYHVVVRGNNKDYIFKHDEDKVEYLRKVKKHKEKYKSKLYSYIIMDNHAHLLMEVSKIPLAKVMQLIQQTYTQYYNKEYNRTGHVFEQRYKAILCNKDEYLLTLIKYIHNNPQRAGISDINYKWSSHKDYISNKLDISDIDFPLSLFSNQKEMARNRYLEYVMDKDIQAAENMNYELIPDEILNNVNMEKDEKRSMKDIISELERLHKTSVKELMGRSKNRDISRIKKYFVKEVIGNGLMSQKELAQYLRITEMAVSKLVNKV